MSVIVNMTCVKKYVGLIMCRVTEINARCRHFKRFFGGQVDYIQ